MANPACESLIECDGQENVQIDLDQTFRETKVQEILDELDRQLVGLQKVKARIKEIAAFLMVDRLRRDWGLKADRPVLHMSFTGRPGTGKTTVAMKMAQILHCMGYIRRNHLVVAQRDDLVGQYVGHTAPKTKEVLKKAMGGVLFIDEAYYLFRKDNERDYGQETIEILLQVMENQKDDLVVIFAGYKERMDEFYRMNPGMRSRVTHHIDFPDYLLDELLQIGGIMLAQQGYYLDNAASQAFRTLIEKQLALPNFANARTVRNAIDLIKLRQANRLFANAGVVLKKDLARIEAEDVPIDADIA
ncbi:CbbX [Desulforamulus profundi]|uniref:CbbX n=1 Tax=Desulforamulus profundi TaxID=1383067 RepID=A0A2C6MIZ5_9FIRM|nr:AAA family ATPase [Desulforamulus profundi]PHJ39794.1 CbbX [Desulforamulus profundi]